MEARLKLSYSLVNSSDSTTSFWMTSAGPVPVLPIYTRTPEAPTELVSIMQKGSVLKCCSNFRPHPDWFADASKTYPYETSVLRVQWLASFPERRLDNNSNSCNGMQLVFWFLVFGEINRIRFSHFSVQKKQNFKSHSHVLSQQVVADYLKK
jgi:hypothetical protein